MPVHHIYIQKTRQKCSSVIVMACQHHRRTAKTVHVIAPTNNHSFCRGCCRASSSLLSQNVCLHHLLTAGAFTHIAHVVFLGDRSQNGPTMPELGRCFCKHLMQIRSTSNPSWAWGYWRHGTMTQKRVSSTCRRGCGYSPTTSRFSTALPSGRGSTARGR